MGKSKKEQKAITLIALVVTIVVLLILAGISIATLTGENGIINKAQEAKKKTEQAQKEEEEKLADIEDILGTDTSGFNEEKGVNSPRIGDTENKTGLIPIKYIGSGKWEVCAETDPEWYNYKEDEMNWANAMLSDGTYKK